MHPLLPFPQGPAPQDSLITVSWLLLILSYPFYAMETSALASSSDTPFGS